MYEDHIDVQGGGDLLQFADHSCRDATAPVRLKDRKIVNVNLTPVLLEFVERIGR